MKRRLITCMAFLCAIVSWGQTDVTSEYLTNADFEGEYTVQSNPSSDRAIYAPNGWTVNLTNQNGYDLSVLKSGDLASNSFGGFTLNAEERGEQTYWVRYRWGSNQVLKISQVLANLPAGVYCLTADVLNYSTDYNYTVMIMPVSMHRHVQLCLRRRVIIGIHYLVTFMWRMTVMLKSVFLPPILLRLNVSLP